jgi:cardiolipin synthase
VGIRSPVTPVERWLPLVRRAVLTIVATPFLVAIGMTLIDSYRRRGRRAVSFPTAPPSTVPVGDGEVTTYTFGTDLYDDMIAAIEGAQRQVLFETYIWKADDVGLRFKSALAAAAARGVEVYLIYDAFANLVVSPRFKRFPAPIKVLRYPVYAAGWRPFDLRPIRPRPSQDPGRRRVDRVRRRLQHRGGLRHRVA